MKVSLDERGFAVALASELDLAMAEWLLDLEASGLSARTVRHYGWHAQKLVDWLQARGIAALVGVKRRVLREWSIEIRRQWAPATCKQAIAAAKSFFRWCCRENLTRKDLGKKLALPRVQRRVQRVVAPDEVRALLAACPDTRKGVRDRAIISLLFDTGLRAAELCRLTDNKIDLVSRSLAVVVKGGDEKPRWFGETTVRYLLAWGELRGGLARPGVAELFVSTGGIRPGTALTVRGLGILFKNLSRQAGIAHLSPHAFRRGFAVDNVEAGASDDLVMKWGGWQSARTFRGYTATVRAGKVYPKFSPMDRLDKHNEQT